MRKTVRIVVEERENVCMCVYVRDRERSFVPIHRLKAVKLA